MKRMDIADITKRRSKKFKIFPVITYEIYLMLGHDTAMCHYTDKELPNCNLIYDGFALNTRYEPLAEWILI